MPEPVTATDGDRVRTDPDKYYFADPHVGACTASPICSLSFAMNERQPCDGNLSGRTGISWSVRIWLAQGTRLPSARQMHSLRS